MNDDFFSGTSINCKILFVGLVDTGTSLRCTWDAAGDCHQKCGCLGTVHRYLHYLQIESITGPILAVVI